MEKLLEYIPVSPALQNVIGVLIIIVLTLIFAFIVKSLLYFLLKKVTVRTKTDLDDLIIIGTQRYIYSLVYILGVSVLFNFIQGKWQDLLGEKLFIIIDGLIYSVGILIVSTIIVKLLSVILGWYASNIASKTETNIDDEIIPLIERVLKTTIYVIAILIILEHFEVDISGLLTILGVGSLAIALAAKDTISNMIGGFIIMIDRPFRIGDRVKLEDGTTCIVSHIGVRSSKFLTFDNTYIITPNAELMNSTIHNLTYPFPQIRLKVDVGVGYGSDIKLVRDIMLEEADSHPKVLKDPPPDFAFLKFGESSLDVSLRCRVENIADHFSTECELREQILNRFRKENIEIPFPQRVVTHINLPDSSKKA